MGDNNNGNISWDDDMSDPDTPPRYGSLKESRVSRFSKYLKIQDHSERVLQVIIDHGPTCVSLIIAYSSLNREEINNILNELTSPKISAIKIYPSESSTQYYYSSNM